jgi:hypothetical protein
MPLQFAKMQLGAATFLPEPHQYDTALVLALIPILCPIYGSELEPESEPHCFVMPQLHQHDAAWFWLGL